jgi:hypothetical protein
MFSYTPQFIPQKILVVGCGGTGSRLIPLIAQFVKTCPWVLNPEMVIVDDDIVEEKNLKRQNFVKQDVEKKKAVVLAQRYSKAYDIMISPITERIYNETSDKYKHNNEFEQKLSSWGRERIPTLVILCVDSAEARRDILQVLAAKLYASATLLLDTGNENDFGQVKIGGLVGSVTYDTYLTDLEKMPMNLPITAKLQNLPLDVSYFADMVSTAAPSCADLDQTMAINCQVANVAFGLIQNWYYAKPLTTHQVNVSLAHGSIPQYMDARYMARVCRGFINHRANSANATAKRFILRNFQSDDCTQTLREVFKQHMAYERAMAALATEQRIAKEKLEAEAKAKAEAEAQAVPVAEPVEVSVADAAAEPVKKTRRKRVTEEVAQDPERVLSMRETLQQVTAA